MMKNYDLVIPSVKRVLKFNSKDIAMGYILGIWECNVIDNDTYKKLKDFIINGNEIVKNVKQKYFSKDKDYFFEATSKNPNLKKVYFEELKWIKTYTYFYYIYL